MNSNIFLGWLEVILCLIQKGYFAKSFSNFSLALEDCSLRFIKCKGDLYTWCNRRKGDEMICAKLDRFVCDESWHNLYPMSVAENHAFFGSDHRHISIQIHDISSHFVAKHPK